MMEKRGQAAMEFLMTYGWAILVVLVAIGALAYFGVLSPDQFLPEKCLVSSGSGMFCDKFSVVGTAGAEAVNLKITNSLSESVTAQAASSEICLEDDSNCCQLAADTVIAADGSATLAFSADGSAGDCATFVTGDGSGKIKSDISLTVADSDGFNKVVTGTLVAKSP